MRKIGMIVPTADNSFFSSLIHQAEKCLSEQGIILMVADSANSAEREKEVLQEFASLCEGILDVSGLSELKDEVAEDYPLVFVDRKPLSEREIPWVGNDDSLAMEEATAFLIEKGCENILLMPGFIAEHQNNPRVIGYRKALEENGLIFDPSYILNRKGVSSSEEETAELVLSCIKEGRKIDGIITSSDRAAFGAVKGLGRVGKYVPEDVKLISFDNSPYSLMASPSVTSIDRNSRKIAEEACKVLLAVIDKKQVPKETLVPVSLVKRDSTR